MTKPFYLATISGVLALALGAGPAAPPQPRIFEPGLISRGGYESHPAFSPSGDTLFYLTCSADLNSCTICWTTRRAGKWQPPAVAPFSGQYMDADPFLTRDGRTLYFISNRPVCPGDPSKTDSDLWRVTRTARGWSAPVHLEGDFNSPADEYYPTVADNGTLYFGSKRPGGYGAADLYRCRLANGRYGAAENLGPPVNTADNEYEPFIAPDESYLLFVSTRPVGLQHADLYLATTTAAGWTAASKLPAPLNSEGTEFSPKVSRDGRYFYFSSTRPAPSSPPTRPETLTQLRQRLDAPGNGLGDIYWVEAATLPLPARRPTTSPE